MEQKEFLDFWVPRLKNLHSPYILFSVIDTNEKKRIDDLIISPKPDTFISFLAYFKPLSIPYSDLPSLQLQQAPERKGFTAVEWGGILDK